MLAEFAQQLYLTVLGDLESAHDERRFEPRSIELSNKHAQRDVSGINFDRILQQRNNPIFDTWPKVPAP